MLVYPSAFDQDAFESSDDYKGVDEATQEAKEAADAANSAAKNAAQLAAGILKRYGWGIDKLTKHQDYSGKYCPHRTLDLGWKRFVAMVEGYLTSQDAPEVKPEPPKADNTAVDVFYCVRADGKWYPEVKNLTDYAGLTGKAITDVAIRVTKGSVRYRVHVKGKGWLPWVTGYNLKDTVNGYAGNG